MTPFTVTASESTRIHTGYGHMGIDTGTDLCVDYQLCTYAYDM